MSSLVEALLRIWMAHAPFRWGPARWRSDLRRLGRGAFPRFKLQIWTRSTVLIGMNLRDVRALPSSGSHAVAYGWQPPQLFEHGDSSKLLFCTAWSISGDLAAAGGRMMMKGLRAVLDVSLSILVVWFGSVPWSGVVQNGELLPQYWYCWIILWGPASAHLPETRAGKASSLTHGWLRREMESGKDPEVGGGGRLPSGSV